MCRPDERGSITVMSLGFLLLIGALTVVVVNASAAFLQRQELNNLADGAALADGVSDPAILDIQRRPAFVPSALGQTDGRALGLFLRRVCLNP